MTDFGIGDIDHEIDSDALDTWVSERIGKNPRAEKFRDLKRLRSQWGYPETNRDGAVISRWTRIVPRDRIVGYIKTYRRRTNGNVKFRSYAIRDVGGKVVAYQVESVSTYYVHFNRFCGTGGNGDINGYDTRNHGRSRIGKSGRTYQRMRQEWREEAYGALEGDYSDEIERSA